MSEPVSVTQSPSAPCWTAWGPAVVPLCNLDRVLDAEGWAYAPLGRAFLSNVAQSLEHKSALYSRLHEITAGGIVPVWDAPHRPAGTRPYVITTGECGTIDFGLFAFAPVLLRVWVSTELAIDTDATVSFQLRATGPVSIRVDGNVVAGDIRFGYVEPHTVHFDTRLQTGTHLIDVVADMLVWREAPLPLGLFVTGVQNADADFVSLHWLVPNPSGMESTDPSLPDYWEPTVSERYELTMTTLPASDRCLIAPPPFLASGNDGPDRTRFSTISYGTHSERAQEALAALSEATASLPGALARAVSGADRLVSEDAIDRACTFLERRFDCADFVALWLHLALFHDDRLCILSSANRNRVEAALLGFKYWIDEPGIDAMCFFTENHQIIFHTAAHLSGSRFPDRWFASPAMSGGELKRVAASRMLEWISRKRSGGFSEWDSSAYLAMDAYALLAAVEFSPDEAVVEHARRLLDDVFLAIALQSWKGVHGSSHGRCYVNSLKSALHDGTSGLQRIAWGMGGFRGEDWATIMFALSSTYSVPEWIAEVAANTQGVHETRTRSWGRYRFHADLRDDSWNVHTITRRTEHYLMSAAIEQRPGTPGIQEHLWQLTLGPDAIIFTNYPANTEERGHVRPNFWAGSIRLPRVGMHNRCAICWYDLDRLVGLGRTHAHFPISAFDEWRIDGHWAFARVGEGYAGLWSDGVLELQQDGFAANRELNTTSGWVWIAIAGSEEEDGSFSSFIERCLSAGPVHRGSEVSVADPDGSILRMHRTGTFSVDGKPVSLWTERIVSTLVQPQHPPIGATA